LNEFIRIFQIFRWAPHTHFKEVPPGTIIIIVILIITLSITIIYVIITTVIILHKHEYKALTQQRFQNIPICFTGYYHLGCFSQSESFYCEDPCPDTFDNCIR